MMSNKNIKLSNIYLFLLSFLGISVTIVHVNFSMILIDQWPTIFLLTVASTLLAYYKIKLPLNGNSFSLDSSIYLAILFIYGLELTLIVLMFTIFFDFLLYRKLAWWKHVSNFGIYSSVLFITGVFIDFVHITTFSNETIIFYIAALLLYVFLNTMALSIYFSLLQGTSLIRTVGTITNDAVYTYLITAISAILISIFLSNGHFIGVILYTAVALFISLSFQRYFNMFKELRRVKETYKSLFDYNPDIVFIFDLEGNLKEANENFKKVTGFEKSDFEQLRFSSIISPAYMTDVKNVYQKVLKGQAQYTNINIRHKNDNTLKMEVMMVPVIIDNTIHGIIGYAKDVTKIKETEDLLKRSEKLSVVGELAAGVAHEIRNPLTTIKGLLQLEKDNGINREHQNIMISEIDRINEIVTEFLNLAKPQQLSLEAIDLYEIIQELVTLSEVEAQSNGISFLIHNLQDDNRNAYGNANQLKQVCLNVIKNAMEAMETSGGFITISLKKSDEFVIVVINDEGVGIPQDRLSRIGEPFFTLKEKGMGLGMTVCYKIMEEHKGKIKIQSKEGQGTSVEIYVPSYSSQKPVAIS
jgi:PAS domain S-box-containing protein